MKEDNENNNENRVTTETLFSDIKEKDIIKGKKYVQIEESYVDGDRVYIDPKTEKKIVYIDVLNNIAEINGEDNNQSNCFRSRNISC